jgi:hypothetical protein
MKRVLPGFRVFAEGVRAGDYKFAQRDDAAPVPGIPVDSTNDLAFGAG